MFPQSKSSTYLTSSSFIEASLIVKNYFVFHSYILQMNKIPQKKSLQSSFHPLHLMYGSAKMKNKKFDFVTYNQTLFGT